MNREIKFNVWDIERHNYFRDVLSLENDKITKWATLEIRTSDSVKWLQFTGLKDKNGKEIYEGDIIKESDSGIFEVIWDSKWAKFKLDHSRTNSNIQYPEWNRGVEMKIIGNVYENLELLKTGF